MNSCVVFDFFYLYTDWFYWNTRRNTLIGCDASKNGILPLMEASSNQAIALGTPQTPFFDSHISEVRGRGTPFADMATPVRLSPSSKLCRTFRALLNFRMHKPLKDCVCIAHACVSAFRSPRPIIKLLKSITEIIDGSQSDPRRGRRSTSMTVSHIPSCDPVETGLYFSLL